MPSFDSIPVCREFYFSDLNLSQDWYLRERMTTEGYVYLTVVANFNRTRALTSMYNCDSLSQLIHILHHSSVLEIIMAPSGKGLGLTKIRGRLNWHKYTNPALPLTPGPVHPDTIQREHQTETPTRADGTSE